MRRKPKVLLLGWDAADWKVINPLMDSGLMPNLKKFVESGTISNLETLDPPYSPMLWTSISTGKRPYKHGVHGFTEVTPDGKSVRPVMSISRKCKAIWNILTQNEKKTHVVGWWPSHPAEPINGVMISNFFQKSKGTIDAEWPMSEGTVHPKEEADHFAQFRMHFQEISAAHILPFVPEAEKARKFYFNNINAIASITAHATSLHAAFTNIIRSKEWDFAALYLDAIDHYCHGFMQFHPPKRPHISQEEFDYFKGVVTAGYRFHDMMLGRIMSMIDDDTTLMLISDHGFQPDHLRPRDIPKVHAGPAYEHSDYGIMVVKGPGIKKDHITYGANLLDICPTLLTLMGLSVGEDMDGRVITGIFENTPEITSVPSWETVEGNDGMIDISSVIEDEDSNEAAIKQLENLGYIEKMSGDIAQKIAQTRDNTNYNLARALIDGGQYEEAISILEDLFARHDEVATYGFRLATCYQTIGRLADARSTIDKIRNLDKYEVAVLDVMEGTLLIGEGKPKEALSLLKQASSQVQFVNSRINLQLARAYMMLRRWSDAKRALHKEIEIDYDTPVAHSLLGRIYLFENYYELSADSYLNALGMTFNDPTLHQGLGLALFKMGKYEEAASAFENCLIMAPHSLKIREILVNIYENHLNQDEKAQIHKDIIAKVEKPTIYIVSGLPRSGTSMMMQMLEAGGMDLYTDGERTNDENNPKGYKEHNAVKTLPRNKEWLSQSIGKAVKVIAQLLPHLSSGYEYQILFMERNLEEVISSQNKMLKRLGKKNDKDYPLHLLETYKQHLKKAKRWLSKRKNVKVMYIQHSSIIENPMENAIEINQFLNLQLDVQKMARVVDPALYREKSKV